MAPGSVLIMAIILKLGFTAESLDALRAWPQAAVKVGDAIESGMQRVLVDMENALKTEYFRGGPGAGGGVTPLGVRTGALRQAITHELDGRFAGYVGTMDGPTNAYAGVQLGGGEVTVTPKKAQHLWIPIADNLSPSGIARLSPREAMSQLTPSGKKLARMFRSKKGNLVVFMPEAGLAASTETGMEGLAPTGARFKRGKKKGLLKGKLLFALKDEVRLKGTDALVKAITDRLPRAAEIFGEEISRVFG